MFPKMLVLSLRPPSSLVLLRVLRGCRTFSLVWYNAPEGCSILQCRAWNCLTWATRGIIFQACARHDDMLGWSSSSVSRCFTFPVMVGTTN
ncbi:hypothetical protein F4808DRAFT_162363 [Astrocystis sublimbata]|nr:hypothetical protein F4808DRAFT_162363 [Astrocystis sublimbata]